MSRGPGKWQRLILDALKEHEGVIVTDYVLEVFGRSLRREEYNAMLRAVTLLERRGLCRRASVPAPAYRRELLPRLVVLRPDVPERARLRYDGTYWAVSVAHSPKPSNSQHLKPPTCLRCGAAGAALAARGGVMKGCGGDYLCEACIRELVIPFLRQLGEKERAIIAAHFFRDLRLEADGRGLEGDAE